MNVSRIRKNQYMWSLFANQWYELT